MTRDSKKYLVQISLSLAIVCACDFQARAADVVVAEAPSPEEFSETFDKAPLTSGLPLVGLRLDTDSMLSNNDTLVSGDIYVALPSYGTEEFCVRASTQDARYSALNPYRVSSSVTTESIARLDAVTRQYTDVIEEYKKHNLAIKAYLPMGIGCSPVKAIHIPEVPDELPDRSQPIVLEAQVNSRGREVRASLNKSVNGEPAAEPSISVACNTDRSLGSLAFDQICQLPVSNLDTNSNDRWFLVLILNDGFDDARYEFALHLPRF